jgi:CheY-like chemotaxis protein
LGKISNFQTASKGSITTRHSANELSCKGIRVLFAEDNPVNTKLMKILLKNLGCHFDAVPDGQVACNVLQKNHYDVVLMDVQMPIMNGLEATKIIQEEINNQIPIITLTAAALQEEKNKCYQSGMNDILLKPVSVEELKKNCIYGAISRATLQNSSLLMLDKMIKSSSLCLTNSLISKNKKIYGIGIPF